MDHMYPSQLLCNHRANSQSQLAAIFAISGWILQASICMVQLTTHKPIWVEGALQIIFRSQGCKILSMSDSYSDFIVCRSDYPTVPKLCGYNTGQHIMLDTAEVKAPYMLYNNLIIF